MFQYNFNKGIVITEKAMPKSLQEMIDLGLSDFEFIIEELKECKIIFNSNNIKNVGKN